jgi:tellurite resistance protein TehA-like permease
MLGAQPHHMTVAYISLGLWFVAAVSFAPSALRYIRGPYNLVDAYRTGIFFMAVLWTGGLGRLIFIPQAEDVRIAILAMSCALAVYLLILARQGALK